MNRTKQILKYVIGDYFFANLSWFGFNIIRYYYLNVGEKYHSSLSEYFLFSSIWQGQIIFPLLWMVIFYFSGYYNQPFLKSRLQELFITFISVASCAIIAGFVAIFNDQPRIYDTYELLLFLFLLAFTLIYSYRLLITQIATKHIHNRRWGFNTLIVGNGKRAASFAQLLNGMKKSLGYRIVGYVAVEGEKSRISEAEHVLNFEDIEEKIRDWNVQQFIVVPDVMSQKHLHATVSKLYRYNLPIKMEAQNSEIIFSRVKTANIYGEPLVDIASCAISDSQRNIKRALDIAFSAVALLVLSPLYVYLALRIKRDSPGRIIYKQQRIGYRKKPFMLYKFRTMVANAEPDGPALSSEEDDRITPFGKFMRKYRLDELPQFWNVFIGDMSLVGPRPEREYFIEQIMSRASYYSLLHQVRPGITSWGMVKFGYAKNVNEMIRRLHYDIVYLENMSLLVDLKIIIYTVRTVFSGQGL